jgi:hypothetical protein
MKTSKSSTSLNNLSITSKISQEPADSYLTTSKISQEPADSYLHTLSTKTSFFDDKETGLVSSHASTRTEDLLAEIMEVENIFAKTRCAGCGTKKPRVPEEDVLQKKML